MDFNQIFFETDITLAVSVVMDFNQICFETDITLVDIDIFWIWRLRLANNSWNGIKNFFKLCGKTWYHSSDLAYIDISNGYNSLDGFQPNIFWNWYHLVWYWHFLNLQIKIGKQLLKWNKEFLQTFVFFLQSLLDCSGTS